MRFAILASGSKGNAALIESKEDLILLDCGISGVKLKARMNELGTSYSELTAIIVTHDHSDHICYLDKIVSLTDIRPHMTRGTAQELGLREADFVPIKPDQSILLAGNTMLTPYTIPHDAREAVQFCFQADSTKLAFATDIGKPNSYLCLMLANCNALVLECNYDDEMLDGNNKYPPWLKQRIRGGKGHLSNEQAASLLHNICHDHLRHVVAAHLSDNNNTPAKVRNCLLAKLRNSGYSPALNIAQQDTTTSWFEVA